MAIASKSKYTSKRVVLGIDCQSCQNSTCLVKRNLKSEITHQLAGKKSEIRCKKGQQFIIEGSQVSGLYFILSGKVKVIRTGLNGREQILRFASDGDIIGHRGFGTEDYYTIGAVALEDTVLCYFTKDSLKEALLLDASFTYDMMLFYANELNKSENKVKIVSQMTVRERVIDMLLYLLKKFNQKNNYLDISLSRKDYADYIGSTEEQVIRVFSALKKEKLIIASGKRIGIVNSNKLEREIEDHNHYTVKKAT